VKAVEAWHSDRIDEGVRLVRWGTTGTPVLLFPTAGGDAEEAERFGLIGALGPLMGEGRVKLYAIDSISGRSWLREEDPRHSMWLQNQFDAVIAEEIVPAIRADCRSDTIELVSAGASIGAFWALEVISRHPDVFRLAICMSGTFDLSDRLHGHWSDDFYDSSPLHFLPNLDDGWQLELLRRRFVILACGQGRWENPGESWRVADVLGDRGIPNRVDLWSHDHDHDWPTWREMLPLYLDDLG
jgi:esterase/lipase superfamily enzyme